MITITDLLICVLCGVVGSKIAEYIYNKLK